MIKTLTELLIKSGLTWFPKKKAEFLIKNNVVVLPCDIGDKLYIHKSLLPKEKLGYAEQDKIPPYFEGEVVSLRKNRNGWFVKVWVTAFWMRKYWDEECGPYEEPNLECKLLSFNVGKLDNTIFKDTISLDTYPDNDIDKHKTFEVPTGWLIDILESLDNFNERQGVNLNNFLNNYCYNETDFIYEQAIIQGKLISEKTNHKRHP